MPIFNYKCSQCQKVFELLLPKFDSPAKCPDCGSEDLEKLLNRFAAVTHSAGSVCPAAAECPSASGGCGCTGCCHHH